VVTHSAQDNRFSLVEHLLNVGYNYYYFGSIFDSGYGTQVLQPSSSHWSTPFWYGLLGVLISPSKGLFIYSPVLLFAFCGVAFVWTKKCEPLLKYLSLGPILVVMLYSKWHFWWGGETYGPRLIADITPVLCLYIYPIWEIIDRSYKKKLVLMTLVVISFLIHTIGAFRFDSSWHKKADISVDDDRLWSFSEGPLVHYGQQLLFKNLSILRTGFSGLPTSPQSPHLLAATIKHQEIPIQHVAGESLRLRVVVTNSGSAIWLFQTNNGLYGVRLGWKWIDREGKDKFTEGRVPIHQDIFPGEREELNIAIWPPSDTGEYVLELGMVSEPETWFGIKRFSVEIVGTCHFEDAINKPLKFIQDRPAIAITPDRPSYSAGEIATVRLNIVNGVIPRNLKFSVFLRHPDGHLRSLGPSTDMPSNPPCSLWTRTGATHILSREFRIDWQLGLRLRNMPEGLYGLEISPILRFTLRYGMIAPMAAVGFLCSLKTWREHLLIGFFGLATLGSFMSTIILERYRLILVPVLIVYAAVGVTTILEMLRRKQILRAMAMVALLLCLAGLQNWLLPIPLLRKNPSFSIHGEIYSLSARIYAAEGKFDQALGELRRLRIQGMRYPNFPEKLRNISLYEGDYHTAWAMQLLDDGRPQAAREQLVLAEGAYADHFHLSKPHYNLGLLYLRFSELSKTQAHFESFLKVGSEGTRADSVRQLLSGLERRHASHPLAGTAE
jgi:hypothetical protein